MIINILIYIAAESTTLLFMVTLFFAILLKKDKQKNQKLLSALVALVCGVLTLEILSNCAIAGLVSEYSANALGIAECIIKAALVTGVHYYILEITSEYTKVCRVLYYLPIADIVILAALTLIFDRGDFVLHISNIATMSPNMFRWLFLFVELLSLVSDFVITLFYLKKVTLKKSAMLICYELLPAFTAAVDYKLDTGFVFTVIALLVLTDYIILGTKQDILIAQQNQNLAEQEKKLAIEQTKITISQIQPHFLYNVISSIMACCKTDPEKATNALADFSDYLRQNMRSLQCDDVIPFSKELDHIKTYLRLEKLRFEDRLEIEYDTEDTNFTLPALSVQPLVENAVKHGIGQRPEGGKVTLRTRRVDGGVIISVIDDGVGFHSYQLALQSDSEHIGMKNVKARIEAMSHGTIDVKSIIGKGTTVTVFIPN